MPNEKHILAEQDYMSGMKYIDIAEKYEVSINTVKSWKKRHGWSKEKGARKTEKGCTQNKGAGADEREAIAEAVESVITNPDLTDKQRLFCLYYSKSFNATKAYQKAYGCSYETAMTEGCKHLVKPKIKAEIHKLKQAKLNRAMLDESDIFQKYMDIAFADISDFLEFGREELPVMTMFGPLEVEDVETGEKVAVTKQVNTVRFREHTEVDGTLISEVKQGKDGASIKLSDRMKALDWLSNHMDMATEEQRARIDHIKAQTEKIKAEDKEVTEGVMIVDDIPDESQPD